MLQQEIHSQVVGSLDANATLTCRHIQLAASDLDPGKTSLKLKLAHPGSSFVEDT